MSNGSQYSFGEPDIQQQIAITQLLGGEVTAPILSEGHVVGAVVDWGYGESANQPINMPMLDVPRPKDSWLPKQYIPPPIAKTAEQLPIAEAGFGAMIPWLIKILGGVAGGTSILKNLGLIGGGATAGGILAGLLGGGGGGDAFIPGTMIPIGGPGAPEPPAAMIAKEWSTGTARFYMLIDGSIVTRRKNGVWKRWKPARHLVVSRNPKVGTLIRADKRIDKLMRGLARRARRSPTMQRARRK